MALQQLITEVYDQIKDYREGEALGAGMTRQRVATWIEQFEEADREFILTELKGVFAKRYCSRAKAKEFLKELLEYLPGKLGYKSVTDFLDQTTFIDVQPEGKSQNVMLEIIRELLVTDYDYDFATCGWIDQKHFIYLDDVVYTGTTMYNNIVEWSKEEYSPGKTNQQAVEDKTANLILCCLYVHTHNLDKKSWQLGNALSEDFTENMRILARRKIQNHNAADCSYDLVFPLEAGLSESATAYRDHVIAEVDEYREGKGWKKAKDEFFRPAGRPMNEKLFSSPVNRNRFETIILDKGVEILGKAHVVKENMRALGFSLPSVKDFGFGAMCFTWRNIANNTPLVFWYAGGGFTPLFTKRQAQ